MKRETVDLLLGLGVLALGIGILLFTFSSAFTLATHPGTFLQDQLPQQGQQAQGPSASFSWNAVGLAVTFQDTSKAGNAAISRWQWDFGDGNRTTGQNPGQHTYAQSSSYQVSLIVQDQNGKESRAFAQVQVVTAQPRSGESALDPSAQISGLNFDLGSLLLPVSVGLLTIGLYLAMAVIGGMITKAGWNLIKPRPETIRVRIKPRDLQASFEADTGQTAYAAQPPQSPPAVPPPPPQA